MDKGKFFSGLFIMIGLIVLGCMFPCAVAKLKSYDRVVSVKGLCEREVKADKVIWPLVYKVVGDDLNDVYAQIDKCDAAIRSFLTKGGLGDGEITSNVPKISDKYAQEYGANDRAYRYVATCTVSVCSGNVDKVLVLMGNQSELQKSGVMLTSEWDSTPQFRFESLNEIKPGMIEEATTNAREVGEKFAKDSGSSLGKIKDASQGTFSIEDRDSNTPEIKKVRIVTYVTYYLKK